MSIPTVQSTQNPTENYRARFDALCIWIQESSGANLGWEQLSAASGWTHKELMEMFAYFSQTTPMTFVREVKSGTKRADKRIVPTVQP